MISNPTLPSMHGGILASMIDLTGFYTVLASGSMSKSTADLRVDYHRAASRQTLLAEGRLIKAGRSLSAADVRIHDDAGTMVARGPGASKMYLTLSRSEERRVGKECVSASRVWW